MIDAIASIGFGYKGPSYDALRVKLLAEVKNKVKLLINSYRSIWNDTGCTIMGDRWIDGRHRSLINFLVYCLKGIAFIKFVDASPIVTDAQLICNLFSRIVDIVSVQNVIHLVIDNRSNFKAARRSLNKKYENICWSL